MAAGRRTAHSEDAEAALRALVALTAGVGGFAAVGAAANGRVPLIALPTLALLGCLLIGTSMAVAAGAAGSVWLVLLPAAPGEALLVPLTMIVICLAIAVRPDRLLGWLARDAAPGFVPPAADDGWIEEDDGRVG